MRQQNGPSLRAHACICDRTQLEGARLCYVTLNAHESIPLCANCIPVALCSLVLALKYVAPGNHCSAPPPQATLGGLTASRSQTSRQSLGDASARAHKCRGAPQGRKTSPAVATCKCCPELSAVHLRRQPVLRAAYSAASASSLSPSHQCTHPSPSPSMSAMIFMG